MPDEPAVAGAAGGDLLSDQLPGALSVEELRFSYGRGTEELFGGLTHTFAPGRTTALTGASGRGKSTLLYVLGLLLTPSSGRVWLGGQDVTRLPDADRSRLRASTFGFVFQDSELDPRRPVVDSVIEPALYAGQPRNAVAPRALELLERFGLGHRAQHRPGEISGGQAQRIAVCRALVNQPDIVLADEPTGNLDRGNAELVLEVLRAAADEGRTVIIATHDPFVVERADDVVTL